VNFISPGAGGTLLAVFNHQANQFQVMFLKTARIQKSVDSVKRRYLYDLEI
jgi:hypothetical protein